MPGEHRVALLGNLGPLEPALLKTRASGVPTLILSTCLRTEIIQIGTRATTQAGLAQLFGPEADLTPATHRYGLEAIEHILRVAAGLQSAVVGEREVLTQFRTSVALTADHGLMDPTLRDLADTAIGTARLIHRGHLPDPRHSLASLAADFTAPADSVAVLGYGAMGKAVVDALLRLPSKPEVTVFVRTPSAISNQAVPVLSMDQAGEALGQYPALISATAADSTVLSPTTINDILARRTETLTIVDMAMPPDFPALSDPKVTYLSIDDIADQAHRDGTSRAAQEQVHHAATGFLRRRGSRGQTGDVIRTMFEQADRAAQDTARRLAKRLSCPEDIAILEQATRAVTRKVLHHPVQFLAEADESEVATVAQAFGVEPNA